MSIRTVGLVLLVAILAVFVVVNWTAFTTPTSLSLLVGTVDAPLGLLMLMVTALLGVVFLAYIVWLQTSVLLESRRLNRELAAQRWYDGDSGPDVPLAQSAPARCWS